MSDPTPFRERRSQDGPTDSEAYLRVRVTDQVRPDGSILVYLSDGTGLVVRGDLLRRGADTFTMSREESR
jgi:hypothetical protein